MNNLKIVYITGCLGFIGSYVTRACLKKGWYVKGVDKITYASNKTLLREFNQYENFIRYTNNTIIILYDTYIRERLYVLAVVYGNLDCAPAPPRALETLWCQ